MPREFWLRLDEFIAAREVRVDRPRGTPHPRYSSLIYPLDYGYLENTRAGDEGGIDVWLGSLPQKTVTAIICAVDLHKQDLEIKLLIGGTPQEAQAVTRFHNDGARSAILVERPEE